MNDFLNTGKKREIVPAKSKDGTREQPNGNVPNGKRKKEKEPVTPRKDGEVKRNSESKARQKRIQRRLAKGKPVVAGLLRDPPKTLEQRIRQGIEVTDVGGTGGIRLAGKRHTIEVKLVYIGGRRDAETRRESHQVYQKYQVAIHKDDICDVGERQWKRFLLDNPFRESPSIPRAGRKLPMGLYHCHYRLDGSPFYSFIRVG